MGKVKCWEVFQCNEKGCPAYKSRNLKCWLFSGTHCRDAIQGQFIDKMEETTMSGTTFRIALPAKKEM
jgi:hypothetical protein